MGLKRSIAAAIAKCVVARTRASCASAVTAKPVADQTCERVVLAKVQLEMPIELFLSKRSVASALTLAGPAEEIFGMALKHQGKRTALKDEHGSIEPMEVPLGKGPYVW